MMDIPETLGVLESVEATAERWRHVAIDLAWLAEVAAQLAPEGLRLPDWQVPVFMRGNPYTLAGQILLFNALNFCYWGNPKWSIAYAGQVWDGSFGMLMTIKRGLEDGLPLLDGAFLADLTETNFRHLLRGKGDLQLVPERLAICHEVGRSLVRDFGGSFTALLTLAKGDALALVRLLVDQMPSFDDRATLDGQEVRFYKRAQLAVAMLYEAFGGRGWGDLRRVDRLTVFADYKVPQVLRRLGILVYDDDLAATVDACCLLPARDRRELEIRAASILACEQLRRALQPRMPVVMALHVDYWLWTAGQAQGAALKPYHRTVTIAY